MTTSANYGIIQEPINDSRLLGGERPFQETIVMVWSLQAMKRFLGDMYRPDEYFGSLSNVPNARDGLLQDQVPLHPRLHRQKQRSYILLPS